MNTGLSLAPLFRHTVGFDRFDELFNSAMRADQITVSPGRRRFQRAPASESSLACATMSSLASTTRYSNTAAWAWRTGWRHDLRTRTRIWSSSPAQSSRSQVTVLPTELHPVDSSILRLKRTCA